MCDNSCCFEPTFTLNGIPILPSGCQALIAQGKAEALVAVTHLASLGVKRQEPAFWGIHKRQETDRVLNYKRKKQPFRAAFFLYLYSMMPVCSRLQSAGILVGAFASTLQYQNKS